MTRVKLQVKKYTNYELAHSLSQTLLLAFLERNPNFVLVALCLACKNKLRCFGVRTAVWPPLLLFSGAHFRRKPSNTSP